MQNLTVKQQAQIVNVLTNTYVCPEVLGGIHYAYCNSGVMTDLLTDDDRAYLDHKGIDITDDNFDVFGHGELGFTEDLDKLKAIGDIEDVAAYAFEMYGELKAIGALYIQRKW